jgi:hypothetical protein
MAARRFALLRFPFQDAQSTVAELLSRAPEAQTPARWGGDARQAGVGAAGARRRRQRAAPRGEQARPETDKPGAVADVPAVPVVAAAAVPASAAAPAPPAKSPGHRDASAGALPECGQSLSREARAAMLRARETRAALLRECERDEQARRRAFEQRRRYARAALHTPRQPKAKAVPARKPRWDRSTGPYVSAEVDEFRRQQQLEAERRMRAEEAAARRRARRRDELVLETVDRLYDDAVVVAFLPAEVRERAPDWASVSMGQARREAEAKAAQALRLAAARDGDGDGRYEFLRTVDLEADREDDGESSDAESQPAPLSPRQQLLHQVAKLREELDEDAAAPGGLDSDDDEAD